MLIIILATTIRSHRRAFDLMLAAFEMVITFNIAYRTCVVLGAVLLQTSPSRGLNGGRMEAFLRAMKEVRCIPITPTCAILTHPPCTDRTTPKSLTSPCSPPLATDPIIRPFPPVTVREGKDIGNDEDPCVGGYARVARTRRYGGRRGGEINTVGVGTLCTGIGWPYRWGWQRGG